MNEQIRDVILARADRLSAGDVTGMQEHNSPSVVAYTLAPPLVSDPDGHDPKGTEAWLQGFEAPPQRTVTFLEITADREVAFATSLDSMTGTPKGATEPFTLWFRVTLGLRRIGGRWLVTHEHQSVPFYMDGSLRAAVDLNP
jgi:ketosteroid isomerase-like protein